MSSYSIAKQFVQEYYTTLRQSPQLLHGLYQENSRLDHQNSRLDELNGVVTTLHGINEKIQSLYCDRNFDFEVTSFDVRECSNICPGQILVLITGFMSEDKVTRNFVHNLILVGQPRYVRYHVMDDLFRYVTWVGENRISEIPTSVSEVISSSDLDLVPNKIQKPLAEPRPKIVEASTTVAEPQIVEARTTVIEAGTTVAEPQIVEARTTVIEARTTVAEPQILETRTTVAERQIVEQPLPVARKPYALIVKENPCPVSLQTASPVSSTRPVSLQTASPVSSTNPRHPVSSANPRQQAVAVSTQTPPPTETETQGETKDEEVYSIKVMDLHKTVTHAILKAKFKQYGEIKGIRLKDREDKQDKTIIYYFAFVDFSKKSAADKASRATRIAIDGRMATVEYDGARVINIKPGRGLRFQNGANKGYTSNGASNKV